MGTEAPRRHEDVLEQFFAGHLTAGQLTERLAGRSPAPAPGAATMALPAQSRRGSAVRRIVSLALVFVVVAGGGVAAGLAIGARPQPVAAATHSPARVPSAPRVHSTRGHHSAKPGPTTDAAANVPND